MRLSITVMLFGGVFLIPLDAFADSSDDTLMFYLSKSDLVVLGKVTKESGPVFTEEGVPNYICEFEIADVLKGDRTMKGTSISVNIMRFEADKKDHNPLIGRNSECILFLNKQSHSSVPVWVTADFWFGVQQPGPWMAKSLKRLAAEEKPAEFNDGVGSQTGRAPLTAPGELALIEIFSWGGDKCEPADEYHTGVLIAKTVESTGDKLPSEFKIRFRRRLLGGPGSTVWNKLPSRSGGKLKILNGEWLIGYFRKHGDMWVARPNGKLVELARPEDLSNEQLRILQAKFETPFIRVWLPEKDILEDIVSRTKWRMSVAELREAFEGYGFSDDKWRLSRSSFRKKLYLAYPNTRVVFEFSGVVDTANEGRVPVTSSLVAFSIEHPMKKRPDTAFRSPPQSLHYQYIKKLHDRYLARLKKNGVDYQHEEMFHSGRGYGYTFWEKCSSNTKGQLTFVYWTIPGHTGVFARAPTSLIAEDLKREEDAARIKTRNWPIGVCGNRF